MEKSVLEFIKIRDKETTLDVSMSALRNPENKRLLYVGTPRAKNLLNIAMLEDASSDDMGDYLRDLNPDRNVPNQKRLKEII